MRFFTDLLSRHLLRRPATSPRRDSAAAAARADAPASYAGAEDEEEEEVKWDSMLWLPPNDPQTIRVQRIAAHLIALS